MDNPVFQAKIRPKLHPDAQELVNIYESIPGSTGPGCCPEALAAVLDHMTKKYTLIFDEYATVAGVCIDAMQKNACLLRGEAGQ